MVKEQNILVKVYDENYLTNFFLVTKQKVNLFLKQFSEIRNLSLI